MAKPKPRAEDRRSADGARRRAPVGRGDARSLAERAGVTLAALRATYDGRAGGARGFRPQRGRERARRHRSGACRRKARASGSSICSSPASRRTRRTSRRSAASRGAARRDPLLALALNGIVTTSMGWMLAAAGISAHGGRGASQRAGACARLGARDARLARRRDPGLARTMAALDKRLREAERAAMRLATAGAVLCGRGGNRTERSGARDADLAEGHPT